MRGEICVVFSSLLSLASLILLIFLHVGQTNTSTVPRGISMVKVDMSAYGAAIQAAILNPVQGLYANNASAPLEEGAGLRQTYQFGLYSYCGFVNGTGLCGNHTFAKQFRPFDTISADMLGNYSVLSAAFIQNVYFRDSKNLGQLSTAACWMFLLGTIFAFLAFVAGILKTSLTFICSSMLAIFGSFFLLIGASIWTAMIKKSQAINTTLLGITLSEGSGLPIAWAAFACLAVSIIPYMTSCCTYRG